MSAEELQPGERWEWGVKHSQGIRNDGSEQAARSSLAWMLEAHKKARRGRLVPQLVRRKVTDWAPINEPGADQ